MVVHCGSHDRSSPGPSRPGRWNSHECARHCQRKLALALPRKHPLLPRLPLAAGTDPTHKSLCLFHSRIAAGSLTSHSSRALTVSFGANVNKLSPPTALQHRNSSSLLHFQLLTLLPVWAFPCCDSARVGWRNHPIRDTRHNCGSRGDSLRVHSPYDLVSLHFVLRAEWIEVEQRAVHTINPIERCGHVKPYARFEQLVDSAANYHFVAIVWSRHWRGKTFPHATWNVCKIRLGKSADHSRFPSRVARPHPIGKSAGFALARFQ